MICEFAGELRVALVDRKLVGVDDDYQSSLNTFFSIAVRIDFARVLPTNILFGRTGSRRRCLHPNAACIDAEPQQESSEKNPLLLIFTQNDDADTSTTHLGPSLARRFPTAAIRRYWP